MIAASKAALKAHIEKNHFQLFRTDVSAIINNLNDAIDTNHIFDGLIHTSYFLHPEIVHEIAQHQSVETKGKTAAKD